MTCYHAHPRSREHTEKLVHNMTEANIKRDYKPQAHDRTCQSCCLQFIAKAGNQKHCYVCAPTKEFRSLIRFYGVTKPIWDEMLAKQNGCCALCEREPTDVDHCHETGKVRGLLCRACNQALGRVETVPGWVDRVKNYLIDDGTRRLVKDKRLLKNVTDRL